MTPMPETFRIQSERQFAAMTAAACSAALAWVLSETDRAAGSSTGLRKIISVWSVKNKNFKRAAFSRATRWPFWDVFSVFFPSSVQM